MPVAERHRQLVTLRPRRRGQHWPWHQVRTSSSQDYALPEEDGGRLLEAVQGLTRPIPVVLVSGFTEGQIHARDRPTSLAGSSQWIRLGWPRSYERSGLTRVTTATTADAR
jgi:hypothetical protein